MSFNVKINGTWRGTIPWVKISDTWQKCKTAWVKVGDTWEKVFQDFSISADKSSVQGNGTGFSPCGNPGNTDVVTVTAEGGALPITYAWARVGAAADSGPYQANSPTSNVTAFSDANNSVCDADVNRTETWRCTATDNDSQELTVDVDVTLNWADLT